MEENKKEPVKLAGIKKGTIRQKMMSFRLDNDNVLWLESQPNKGRYINDLIRDARARALGESNKQMGQ